MLSVIVILFTILSVRQKKQAAEERIKQNKIRAAEEEFLNLEKNVLCEDGITRVYRNRMYGLIKEEVINIKDCPEQWLALNGFCEVKGKILHELTRHFNISSITIQSYQSWEWGQAPICSVEFKKSNWFSEEGKILSKKEIIAGNNYYHAKTAGERVNLTTSAMTQVFHEINGHYFMYDYGHPDALRLFNGWINEVKYVDGEPVEFDLWRWSRENTGKN